jgi:hypothetical protein
MVALEIGCFDASGTSFGTLVLVDMGGASVVLAVTESHGEAKVVESSAVADVLVGASSDPVGSGGKYSPEIEVCIPIEVHE